MKTILRIRMRHVSVLAFCAVISTGAFCAEEGGFTQRTTPGFYDLQIKFRDGRNTYFSGEHIRIILEIKNNTKKTISYLPSALTDAVIHVLKDGEEVTDKVNAQIAQPGLSSVRQNTCLLRPGETSTHYTFLPHVLRHFPSGEYELIASYSEIRDLEGLVKGEAVSNRVKLRIKAWESAAQKLFPSDWYGVIGIIQTKQGHFLFAIPYYRKDNPPIGHVPLPDSTWEHIVPFKQIGPFESLQVFKTGSGNNYAIISTKQQEGVNYAVNIAGYNNKAECVEYLISRLYTEGLPVKDLDELEENGKIPAGAK